MDAALKSCHCCGLIQSLPPLPKHSVAVCRRCDTPFRVCQHNHNGLAGMFACSALMLYPPAMLIPLIKIEKLGHLKEDSLITSVGTLLTEGYWLIGAIVLLFSILLPVVKLMSILALSFYPHWRDSLKAKAYRWIEWVGRWGMLDVLLMAVLVAYIKLGDLVSIQAGAGLLAFTTMVLMSLVASALFNPHCLWADNHG